MLGLLALAGCGKKPEEKAVATPKETVDTRFRSYLVNNPTVPSEAAVPIMERTPISEGPAGSPFGIVVTMTQLQPSWQSTLSCRLESPAGKLISPIGERSLSFGTNEQGEGWVFIPIANDSSKYTAGSWKAVMGVAGLGEIPFGFAIAPPTAAQKAALADHEEAQKQVLKAFAAFWVAFPHPDLKMTFVTSTKARSGTPQSKYNLFQAAGLSYECTQSYISDADRLNGISYRGSVGFGFTLHRQYTPETRWTDWRDVDRPSGPINEAWQKYTGNDFADPDSSPQAPGMRFTVEKRDGNWVVTSREKARFINGIRRDDDATLAAALAKKAQKEKEVGEKRREALASEMRRTQAGTRLGIPEVDYGENASDPVKNVLNSLQKESTVFSSELFSEDEEISPPPFEVIRMLTEKGGTERSSQKELAESLEATLEEIKAQQQATLKALEEL